MFIIGGLYRGQRLNSPKGAQTRPTTGRLRETLFNICQQSIEGAKFLDIFAGSGAMGLEALSRGAFSTTFIDSHKESVRCIESNVIHLKVQDHSQIYRGEALSILELLEKCKKSFDIIYVDPPYNTLAPHSLLLYSAQIIQWIDTHSLLAPGGLLFVEEEHRKEARMNHLKTLTLKNSRRAGISVLQQYERLC